jgi:hypothetical protein
MNLREIREACIGAVLGALCAVVVVTAAVKTFDYFAPPSPYLNRK